MPGSAFYSHVIFPDFPGDGGHHAVDFTPASLPACEIVEDGPLSAEEDSCLRWLFREGGLDVRHYRGEVLMRRIPALLRALRVSTLADARIAVQRNPRLAGDAIESLVIGVTHFFRDPEAFDALRDRVLPDLVRPGGEASIWCAGCSDGAELYSLAILLAEQGVLHRRYLLGTDCRAKAMERAAAGIFDADAVRSVPEGLLRKYFHPVGESWQVTPWLRQRLRWRTADILAAPEPGPWDLILFRNMSIYLQPQAAALVWSRVHDALRVGGVLVTGKAERPPAGFGFAPLGLSLYRRERS